VFLKCSRSSNTLISDHAVPSSTFEFEALGYTYGDDDLQLNGYTIQQLKDLLDERSHRDRVFASFRLRGFKASADLQISVCKEDNNDLTVDHCEKSGDIFVLGGLREMPWAFDYPYLFDISQTVLDMGLDFHDAFTVKANLYSYTGEQLDGAMVLEPQVVHNPGLGFEDGMCSLLINH
jgi:hypothetical protein